ncbi:MAG: hypothetical protein KDH19_04040 [Geminicoccaceae bacterium]|nr:hypothetical protein [Geminicoccaceae bacterium]
MMQPSHPRTEPARHPLRHSALLLALTMLPARAMAAITDDLKLGEHAESIGDYIVDNVYTATAIIVILVFGLSYALSERPGMLQSGGAKLAALVIGAAAAGAAGALF